MSYQEKILIIENDLTAIKKIQKDLVGEGFDVCLVSNSAEAIDKAFEYNPDLVVCSVQMEPIGGFQILEYLKQTSLTDRVPFIFITSNTDLAQIRKALNLGVDDYFIKPVDSSELIQSIKNKLLKFSKLKELGKNEFKKLSESTPNGLFTFDGHLLMDANSAFLKLFKIRKEDITSVTLEEFLETQSLQKVKEHISQCIHGMNDNFHEKVTFILRSGESFEGTLYISIFEKHTGYAHMSGLVMLNHEKEKDSARTLSEIQDILKSEKINMPDSLEKKLTEVFKKENNHMRNRLKDFFSEREKEVICLSMEGHPIKTIADKLSISDRTVEKHRANLMEKTKSSNMIEVVVYAVKNNLINIQ